MHAYVSVLCERFGISASPCGGLTVMRLEDPYEAAVEFLRVRGMQELIGPVRVGVGTEHAGNQKLGLRETLAQHRHEGNRAADAEITGLLAKEFLGTGVGHLGQPWRQRWGIPAIRASARYRDACPKGWGCLQHAFDDCRRLLCFQRRG